MVRKTKVAVVEHPRGGEGSVEFHHIVSEEELNGHGVCHGSTSSAQQRRLASACGEYRTLFHFKGERGICGQ